jgi:hypothetical protein
VTVSDLLNTEGARPVISERCYDAFPGDTNRYDAMAKRLETIYSAFDLGHGSRSPQNTAKTTAPVLVSPPKQVHKHGLGQGLGGDEGSLHGR